MGLLIRPSANQLYFFTKARTKAQCLISTGSAPVPYLHFYWPNANQLSLFFDSSPEGVGKKKKIKKRKFGEKERYLFHLEIYDFSPILFLFYV
jgi:hypothetical protein